MNKNLTIEGARANLQYYGLLHNRKQHELKEIAAQYNEAFQTVLLITQQHNQLADSPNLNEFDKR